MIINSTTVDIKKSLLFYETLDFDLIEIKGVHYACDKSVSICINENRIERKGVSLYQDDWTPQIDEKERFLSPIPIDGGYLISDGTGSYIKLMTDHPNLQGSDTDSILGSYAGISIESIEYERTIEIWKSLGFNKASGDITKGWVTLSSVTDDIVSIMKPMVCPHIFGNPGLTYFNGSNNESIIAEIRKRRIDIAEEITVFNSEGTVDNIILQDPGGLTFFLFNDG